MVWVKIIFLKSAAIALMLMALVLPAPEIARRIHPINPVYLVPTLLLTGAYLFRLSRKFAQLRGAQLLENDGRPFILFLRAFDEDHRISVLHRFHGNDLTSGFMFMPRFWETGGNPLAETFEETLVRALDHVGPVLSIGAPGTKKKLPPLGASRVFIDQESWKKSVTELSEKAALVICLVRFDSDGIAWEVDQCMSHLGRNKLILILGSHPDDPSLKYHETIQALAERYSVFKDWFYDNEVPSKAKSLFAIRFEASGAPDVFAADAQEFRIRCETQGAEMFPCIPKE